MSDNHQVSKYSEYQQALKLLEEANQARTRGSVLGDDHSAKLLSKFDSAMSFQEVKNNLKDIVKRVQQLDTLLSTLESNKARSDTGFEPLPDNIFPDGAGSYLDSCLDKVTSYMEKLTDHEKTAACSTLAEIIEGYPAAQGPIPAIEGEPQTLQGRFALTGTKLTAMGDALRSNDVNGALAYMRSIDALMRNHWSIPDPRQPKSIQKPTTDEEQPPTEEGTSDVEADTDSEDEQDPEEKGVSGSGATAEEDTADKAQSHLEKLSI